MKIPIEKFLVLSETDESLIDASLLGGEYPVASGRRQSIFQDSANVGMVRLRVDWKNCHVFTDVNSCNLTFLRL